MVSARAWVYASIATIASLVAVLVPFATVAAADPVLVGAGDIASCSRTQDEATAKVAAKSWAQIYDGHSLVTLRRAIDGFDITAEYAKLKGTKVLYVISKTDKLFDITLSIETLSLRLRTIGISETAGSMVSILADSQMKPLFIISSA